MAQVTGKVLGCKQLKSKDLWGKSDPYVKVICGDSEYKTDAIDDSEDPVWADASFAFGGLEMESDICFVVLDKDMGGDDEIGRAHVPLHLIPHDEPTTYTFSIGMNAPKKNPGTITVEMQLQPPEGFFD
eukprot:CAMPEP_0174300108 /NCGR_PEP_ID=MMETSP0809-20121228/58276_1 /TAXON_ID=73025 ORGANISM="Eutreptiella gymnastica-like, Strain CCMP1594" /NCGR_SAMPLE_ID=MMETSP0809 /ASSEMBLY_ACC=CAM_ASM_000658 /LENGTH=128 /DNA_ID=CAMNT_0015405641 /DNA_START=25 /DNA_END=411 /DNA_ORIENTATION=+